MLVWKEIKKILKKWILALTPLRKWLRSLDSARDFRFASGCVFDWKFDADFAEEYSHWFHWLTRVLGGKNRVWWVNLYGLGKIGKKKRLKTFENVQKYSKIFKFWVETFKNIQKYSTFLDADYAGGLATDPPSLKLWRDKFRWLGGFWAKNERISLFLGDYEKSEKIFRIFVDRYHP